MGSLELDYSTFSDDQTLKNIRLILASKHISHIRAVDQELLDSADLIRGIDAELGRGKLISVLTQVKNFIPVTDSLFFLLEAFKEGVVQHAIVVLDEAAVEQKFITREQLMEILKNRDEVPMDWAITLAASAGENRYAAAEFNKSSLNMDALRDFH